MSYSEPRFYGSLALIVIMTTVLSPIIEAQHKANDHWYFGRNIGLSFAGGTPRQIASPILHSFEAASAVSDAESGELLFYTDGTRVWNRNHALMPNGRNLEGHHSSTQGALIMPAGCQNYYIFTSDAGRYESVVNRGVQYSLVDLRLNGGLGDVTDEKNVLLAERCGEKLTAAIHANDKDYWLIAHGVFDDKFYAWHVSADGIAEPVISEVGVRHNNAGFQFDGVGALKASPDGRRLALTTYSQRDVELFDFDNASGRVSGAILLRPANAGYGISFAPNSSKLYVTTVPFGPGEARLVQYDVSAGTPDAIRNSAFVLYNNFEPLTGMQLGPDAKIYVSVTSRNYVAVINNPNEAGLAADFVVDQLRLDRPSSCWFGMINMYDGPPVDLGGAVDLKVEAGEDAKICAGGSVRLSAVGASGNYHWTPAEGLDNPESRSPLASPEVSTLYRLRVETTCGIAEDSVLVTVVPPPLITLDTEYDICRRDSVQLRATLRNADSFQWFPRQGLSNPFALEPMAFPDASVTYTLQAIDEQGCVTEATVRVNVHEAPIVNLGPEKLICPGESAQLRASGGVRYVWWPVEGLSNSEIPNPIARPKQTTSYRVDVYDEFGCVGRGWIRVVVLKAVLLGDGQTLTICRGDSVPLPLQGPAGDYLWTPAEGLNNRRLKNPIASPERTTSYTVRLRSRCGDVSGTVLVRVVDPPVTDISDKQELCRGDAVRLRASGGTRYAWQPAEGLDDPSRADPLASPERSIEYRVLISDDNGCSTERRVMVEVLESPSVDIGPDRQICPGEVVRLQAGGGLRYRWTPSEGLSADDVADPLASPERSTRYSVTVWNAEGCSSTASLSVNVAALLDVRAVSVPRICFGDTVRLAASGGSQYRWEPVEGLSDPNSAMPLASPQQTTRYTVHISDGNCSQSTSLTLSVLPPIAADAGADVTICRGESHRLRATGGVRYEWEPAEGLDDAGSPTPLAQPRRSTNYRVSVFNELGCSVQDEVFVKVLKSPAVAVGADRRICFGESADLQVMSEGRVRWEPTTGLNDPASRSPRATPAASTRYTATITNDEGCITTATQQIIVEPLTELELAISSGISAALPGRVVPLLVHIRRRGDDNESRNISPMSISLAYDHERIAYQPGSIQALKGIDDRNVNAVEGGAGSNRLLIETGDVLSKAAAITLRLDFMVLLFPHQSREVPLRVESVEFASGLSCYTTLPASIPLSDVCLHDNRGVFLSGTGYHLEQNTPNPAPGVTDIGYRLGLDAHTTLTLYDHLGRVVAVPIDEWQQSGAYTRQLATAELPAGSYFYQLRSGPFSATRSLMIKR